MAPQGAKGFAGVGVPQPHSRVGSCGGQSVSVGAERHAEDLIVVLKFVQLLAGVDIPQPHGVVGAGAGQPVPDRAERHVEHPIGVACQLAEGSPVSAFHSRTVLVGSRRWPVGCQRS